MATDHEYSFDQTSNLPVQRRNDEPMMQPDIQPAPSLQQPVVMLVELTPLDEIEHDRTAFQHDYDGLKCRERQLLDALRTIAQLRQQISDLERLPIAQLRSQVHELQCILEQKEARIAELLTRVSPRLCPRREKRR